MPELPEVETVRRGLATVLEGRRLIRVDQRRADLRYPMPVGLAARLTGRRVRALSRRAKYLLVALDDDMVLIVHLGMSGRMTVATPPAPAPGPHDHLILETEDGAVIALNDPRRFGLVDLVPASDLATHRLFAFLGPEPLGDGFTADYLTARLRGRATAIKSALLDQRIVAGLGNIYVCEALFRARLSPRRRAASVAGVRAARLVPAIRSVLIEAIAAGGSSLRDYVQTTGELGYFQHAWTVYGREGAACGACVCAVAETGGVRRLTQAGRSTFYCPVLQR